MEIGATRAFCSSFTELRILSRDENHALILILKIIDTLELRGVMNSSENIIIINVYICALVKIHAICILLEYCIIRRKMFPYDAPLRLNGNSYCRRKIFFFFTIIVALSAILSVAIISPGVFRNCYVFYKENLRYKILS